VDDCAVYIGSDELVKWVKEMVESQSESEPGDYHFTGSGDSIVIAFKQEDQLEIFVARNYINFKINNDEIKPGWEKYVQGVLDSLEVG
jgi:hypothetical protein